MYSLNHSVCSQNAHLSSVGFHTCRLAGFSLELSSKIHDCTFRLSTRSHDLNGYLYVCFTVSSTLTAVRRFRGFWDNCGSNNPHTSASLCLVLSLELPYSRRSRLTQAYQLTLYMHTRTCIL